MRSLLCPQNRRLGKCTVENWSVTMCISSWITAHLGSKLFVIHFGQHQKRPQRLSKPQTRSQSDSSESLLSGHPCTQRQQWWGSFVMPVTASKIFGGPASGQSYTSQSYPDMVFIALGQVQTYSLFLITLWSTFTLCLHISCLFLSSQGHFNTFIRSFSFSSNLLASSCKYICHRNRVSSGWGWAEWGTGRSHEVNEMGDQTQVLL